MMKNNVYLDFVQDYFSCRDEKVKLEAEINILETKVLPELYDILDVCESAPGIYSGMYKIVHEKIISAKAEIASKKKSLLKVSIDLKNLDEAQRDLEIDFEDSLRENQKQ